MTLVGYRPKADGSQEPMIYMLQSQQDFAPNLFTTGTCLTGVPQYATYLAHRYYDRSMTKDNVAALAAFLITETASQDPKVGGPLHVMEITPENGCMELSPEAIQGLHDRNSRQAERLKQFFFAEDGNE